MVITAHGGAGALGQAGARSGAGAGAHGRTSRAGARERMRGARGCARVGVHSWSLLCALSCHALFTGSDHGCAGCRGAGMREHVSRSGRGANG